MRYRATEDTEASGILPDATFGVPNDALRRRIMDYLPSVHNGTANVAYGWPCEAESITVLHAENLGIAESLDPERNGGLYGLNTLQNLQELYLDGNPDIERLRHLSVDLNDALHPLLNLQVLSLKDCSGILSNAAPIRTLTALTSLDLTNCTSISSLNATLYDPCTQTHLPNLAALNLSGCTGLASCGLKVLAGLPSLVWLSLSGCTGVDSLDCLIANGSFTGASGAYLDLTGVSLTQGLKDDIACLQSSGVTVVSDCVDCGSTWPAGHPTSPAVLCPGECTGTIEFYDCDAVPPACKEAKCD